jgi:hypothetical protein
MPVSQLNRKIQCQADVVDAFIEHMQAIETDRDAGARW